MANEHRYGITTDSIREYAEGLPVKIHSHEGRLVIEATNQGGYDCTLVDLQDVLDWVREHRPWGITP